MLACSAVLSVCAFAANEPKWQLASSGHFTVVTNGDIKQSHAVASRFEQMRSAFGQILMRKRVNLPQPVDIIALRTQFDYSAVVPARKGPLLSDAFCIPGDDRYYFAINLAKEEGWRAISYDFAKLLLYYNYPPVQPWFDEGFAQYFSSLKLGRTVEIGGEPVSVANLTTPFIPLLSGQSWSATAPLLASANQPIDAAFSAESWIVMHYLINQDKLEQAGNYFDLVENQKVAPEQAIQQAFGMSPAQFDQAVKNYFQMVAAAIQAPVPTGKNASPKSPGQVPPMPSDDEVVTSEQDLTEPTGQSWVAEMAIRLPEHRSQTVAQLNNIITQPKGDNSVAHRALAYAYMLNGKSEDAMRELQKAAELDPKDWWPHYYSALVKFRQAQGSGKETEGLANMMQDLKAVLDFKPEFAEADNMLGMARLEGGGLNSAMQSMRAAMQLSPRNQQYQYNMAMIYMAAKQWDAAEAMFKRLQSSSDPKLVAQSKQQLDALPTLKKYGIAPQPNAKTTAPMSPSVSSLSLGTPKAAPTTASPAEDSDEVTVEDETVPNIDRREVKFAKGRVVSVDCSQPPVAIITFFSGAKTLKLRTENYQSLTLVDNSQFNCNWANRAASVNYKAGGKADGDLVSLEVH